MLRELAELYENDTSRLDLFVGGLLESQEGPGPVFSTIILDQFERIRNADRFWFENKQNGWDIFLWRLLEAISVWSDEHTKSRKISFLSGCSLRRRSKPFVTPRFMMSFWRSPVQKRATFKGMYSSGWTVMSNPNALTTYSGKISYYTAVMCLYWAFLCRWSLPPASANHILRSSPLYKSLLYELLWQQQPGWFWCNSGGALPVSCWSVSFVCLCVCYKFIKVKLHFHIFIDNSIWSGIIKVCLFIALIIKPQKI